MVQQVINMKFHHIYNINNRKFGFGIFIKKESIVSKFHYMFYAHVFWFIIGIKFAFKDKLK